MMSRHFDGELRMLSGLGTGLGSGVGTDSSGNGNGSGSGLGLVNNNIVGMGGPLKPDQHFKTILQLMVGVYDADDEIIAVAHSQPLPIHSHPSNHEADNTIINNTTKTNLTINSSVDNTSVAVTGTNSNSDA